jgi:hypothetical protein
VFCLLIIISETPEDGQADEANKLQCDTASSESLGVYLKHLFLI